MAVSWKLQGKTCLITGATQGIGLASAIGIAQAGAETVLVARNRERGEAAMAEVKAKSGNSNVSMLVADLASQESVRQLAAAFKQSHQRLHVLLNNAGGLFVKRVLTIDGIETTFAVNHLAYFLLTELLLDVLEASAPARIINVASAAHFGGAIDFDDLQHEKRYSSFKVYSDSKLANVLFTYELARRLAGTGVTANCLHPGVVTTGFGKNNPGLPKTLITLAGPFMLSPEKGARTSIYLATSPEVEGVTGKYFDKCKSVSSSKQSYDPESARRLWQVSEDMTRPRARPGEESARSAHHPA
jgi:NAD(P)-dependent dehydrogenase (short-subunit alcohol dehydrogenase family)